MNQKEWGLLRKQVFQRDNYTCQKCLDPRKNIEIHHKIPRRSGGSDSLGNLISYCRECHKTIEPGRIICRVPIVVKDYAVTIKIKGSTYERLMKRGTMKDTHDSVIVDLLNRTEGKNA